MRTPEILAPAGSEDALLAALRCGADAVYVGGKQFSARQNAANFDLPQLQRAAELCHLYGAKLYLTVNTLVFAPEFPALAQFLEAAIRLGVDAFLVQDFGLLELIRQISPDVPIHASTQMTIHTLDAAKQARDISAPGRDAQGIYFAVDYLTSVTRSLLDSGFSDGKAVSAKDKKVLVIGGGDTGNDCVGTAIRQGCASVTQLEMMPCPPTERTAANAWPEWPKVLKTDYGQQEAIAVFGSDPRIYQTTVKEFYKDEAGQVCGALIAKLESKVVDEATGRRAMVPTGEEFAIECDLVLIAAGFTGCQPYVAEAFGVDLTKRGTVADTKYATNVPHVFTCGDMRRGQSLVVWALREGRDAAAEVDKSLMGYTNL